MNNEMSLNTAFRPMGSDFFGHTFQVSCGYLKNCVLVCLDRQTSKLNTVRDLKKLEFGFVKIWVYPKFPKNKRPHSGKKVLLWQYSSLFWSFWIEKNSSRTKNPNTKLSALLLHSGGKIRPKLDQLFIIFVPHSYVPSYATGGRAQIRAVWRNMWMKWHQYNLKSHKIRPSKRIFL